MAKITLSDIAGGYADKDLINANNALIEAAVENTISRDGTSPNSMASDLDMNSNQIINLGVPVNNSDAARLQDVVDAQTASLSGIAATLASITDSGGYYAADNVEGALAEIATDPFSNVKDAQQYTDLDAAITDIGSSVTTLLITSSLSAPSTNTVPSTLMLLFLGDGELNVAATKTVTINGPLHASAKQIFTGSGSIVLAESVARPVLPNWFANPRTDLGAAVNAAITAGATRVVVPDDFGTAYTSLTTISVPADTTVEGCGRVAVELGADVRFADISGAYAALRNFKITKTGSHTKSGIQVGDATTGSGDRVILESLYVDGVGQDALTVIQGNLGTLKDFIGINCGRDGVRFTTDTNDNNAWTFTGFIDVRGNTGIGFNLIGGASAGDATAPKSNHGGLIVAQSNGGVGVFIGTRSNHLVVYSESNTGNQIELGTYAYGNRVISVEGATVDGGSGNLVIGYNSGAGYLAYIETQLLLNEGKGLRFGNQSTAGYADFLKTAIREYRFKAAGSSANQTVHFENTASGYVLNMLVDGRVEGAMGVVGGTATTAQLAGITADINTVGKQTGAMVYNSTTGRPVWASGAAAGATWDYADGTTAHTPV